MRLGEQQKMILVALLAKHKKFEGMNEMEKKDQREGNTYSTQTILKAYYPYTKNYEYWEKRVKEENWHSRWDPLNRISPQISTINSLHALKKNGLVKIYGGHEWWYKGKPEVKFLEGRGKNRGFQWNLTEEGKRKAEEILQESREYVRAWGYLCKSVDEAEKPIPLKRKQEMILLIMLKKFNRGVTEVGLSEITKIGLKDFIFWSDTTVRSLCEPLWLRELLEKTDGNFYYPTLKLTETGKKKAHEINVRIYRKIKEIKKEMDLLSKYRVY